MKNSVKLNFFICIPITVANGKNKVLVKIKYLAFFMYYRVQSRQKQKFFFHITINGGHFKLEVITKFYLNPRVIKGRFAGIFMRQKFLIALPYKFNVFYFLFT